jgi:hypothetical protein
MAREQGTANSFRGELSAGKIFSESLQIVSGVCCRVGFVSESLYLRAENVQPLEYGSNR